MPQDMLSRTSSTETLLAAEVQLLKADGIWDDLGS